MDFRTEKLFLLSTIVAILTIGIGAACGGGEPEELQIPVSVQVESMSPETIKVKQGDMVTLKIQVEEAGEFHLHGYDIEKDTEAGKVTELFFLADATGRFKITFHHSERSEEEDAKPDGDSSKSEGDHEDHEDGEGEEIEIGYLEVGPR